MKWAVSVLIVWMLSVVVMAQPAAPTITLRNPKNQEAEIERVREEALNSTGQYRKDLHIIVGSVPSLDVETWGGDVAPAGWRWEWFSEHCDYSNKEGFVVSPILSQYDCRLWIAMLAGVAPADAFANQWLWVKPARLVMTSRSNYGPNGEVGRNAMCDLFLVRSASMTSLIGKWTLGICLDVFLASTHGRPLVPGMPTVSKRPSAKKSK